MSMTLDEIRTRVGELEKSMREVSDAKYKLKQELEEIQKLCTHKCEHSQGSFLDGRSFISRTEYSVCTACRAAIAGTNKPIPLYK